MKFNPMLFAVVFLLLLTAVSAKDFQSGQVLVVSGHVVDLNDRGVPEAHVSANISGTSYVAESEKDGLYILKIPLDGADVQSIALHVSKPGYNDQVVGIHDVAKSGDNLLAYSDVIIARNIGAAFYIAALVLIGIYILISFEIVHRTLAALLGAASILFITYTAGTFNPDYFIISFDNAIHAIDFNVIFLLMGMMLIVGVMKRTGVFQWLAYKSYELSGGNIFRLSVILVVVTAVTSAFLDNVTTMLLLTPVTIEIALVLRMNPLSLLIPLVLASNLGGTSTLIGDPPNIMIGSYAGLTFNDFIINLAPPVAISTIALILMMRMFYGKEYKNAHMEPERVKKLISQLREEYKITNRHLLTHSLIILGFVVGLFIVHGYLHMEPSVAAMIGASLILVVGVVVDKIDVVHMIEREIEWPTLVFFMMLFVIIGAAEETGLIQLIANMVADLSGGSLLIAMILVLWVSGVMSAIIDNIPFTATMLPIAAYLTQTIPGSGEVIWWALALGACFGGNGTLIGASANVVTAGLSERAGHPITFIGFMKFGLPVTIVTMIIATVWLYFMI